MSGLIGWPWLPKHINCDKEQLSKNVQSALTLASNNIQTSCLENSLLHVWQPDSKTSCIQCHDGINVGFTGYLRWLDPALKDQARDEGDCVTLARAFRQNGPGFLNRLQGRFTIALMDPGRNQCLIATDRLGTLPLYYARTAGNGFVYASSIASLLHYPGVSRKINAQALYDYSYFHVIPSPDTIYSEIYKLEPAQYALLNGDHLETAYHWLPTFSETGSESQEELSAELRRLLKKSIASLAPLDNTGCFLSGGLDSSTVTGMFAGFNDAPVDAFSIGFSEEGYDEMEYARVTANAYGANLHEYYVTPDDIVDAIPSIARAYDEPFGNSSAIPAYFCAKLAKEHGKSALLAGDGGDELFAGNERYAKQKIFDIYNKVPAALRKGLLEPALISLPFSKWTPPTRKIRSYIEQARMPMPERMESYNFLKRMPAATIFNDEFLSSVNTDHPDSMLSSVYNRIDNASLMDRMLYLDWKITLADNDLRKVNRMCELAGIQVHYPMLDDELVEFSTRIHPELKLKGQKLRYFYKQSLKGFLPDKIINKPKHGFGLPFGQWLKKSDRLKELIYSNLESAKKRGMFRDDFIDNLIESHRSGHAAYYGSMVWVVAILEQWFHEHEISGIR